jgi:hypothetical protein
VSDEIDRISAEISARLEQLEHGTAGEGAEDEVYERIEGCCSACRFYDRTAFGNVNYAECRRYPPTMVNEQVNGIPRAVWPVVGYDDFCGEYAAEEA